MAWTYLAESAESVSRSNHGSGPSPIVSKTDMLRAFYCPGCDQVTLTELLSGTTCEHSPRECSQGSTSSLAASPAKTLVLQALERAWEASEAGFSTTSQGLSKKQTQDWYFSKTSQQLELVASTVSSKHLPSSGMIVDGRLFQPRRLVPSTLENDGSYLPTPTACDYGKNNGRNSKDPMKSRDRWSLTVRARRGQLPGHPPGKLSPQWIEQAMGFPLSWTEIDVLAIQWFHAKRKQRSKDCAV